MSFLKNIVVLSEEKPIYIDATMDKDGYGKFSALSDIKPLTNAAWVAWYHTLGVLTSKELNYWNTWGNLSHLASFDNAKEAYLDTFSRPNSHFEIDSKAKTVTAEISSPDIAISFRCDPKIAEEKIRLAEDTIKQLIPGFYFPNNWHKNGSNYYGNTGGPKVGKTTFEDLLQSNLKFTPANNYASTSLFDFKNSSIKNLDKILKDTPKLQIKVEVIAPEPQISFGYNEVPPAEDLEGTLHERTYSMVYKFKIALRIVFPLEYAMWATYTEHEKNFIPYNFWTYFHSKVTQAVAPPKGASKVGARYGSLLSVRNYAQKKAAAYKITPQPRVDKLGFAVLRNGQIVYIPEIDDIDGYYKQITAEGYDPLTSKITPPSNIKNLHNVYLYTDWINNIAFYLNGNGAINTWNLKGCVALDDTTIADYLSMKIMEDSKFNIAYAFADKVNKLPDEKLPGFPYLNINSMAAIVDGLSRIFTGLTIANLNSTNIDTLIEKKFIKNGLNHLKGYSSTTVLTPEEEAKINDPKYLLGFFAQRLKELAKSALQKLPTLSDSERPGIETQSFNRFVLELYNTYLGNVQHFAAHLLKQQQVNDEKANTPPLSELGFDLPNLRIGKGMFESLMPHQATALHSLAKDTDNAIIGISPGGGKTILITLDVLDKLNKGLIKRPLIVTPGVLTKDFVTEINTISGGKINVFPLTLTSVRRLLDPKRVGLSYEDLIKYIKGMPLNTIFLSTYESVRNTSALTKDLPYEDLNCFDTEVKAYPFSDFLAACAFDYVANDEVHRLKNTSSNQAQAMSVVMGQAKFKRIATGTLTPNVITDYVGQAALITPAALGSTSDFEKKFLGGKGNTVISNLATVKKIKNRINSYALQIDRDNSDWSYMLPDLKENFYNVPLTDKQTEFYQKIFTEAQFQISKQLSEAGIDSEKELSEESESIVENIIKNNTFEIEKFLCAPEEVEAFLNHSTLNPGPDDLVSPKAKMVNLILGAHFNMDKNALSIVTETLKESGGTFKPSPENSVVIFGYNTYAAPHIFRNLKPEYKKMAVLYTAGDDEAIRKFIEDPNIKILVASEKSIQEGKNLQCFTGTTPVLIDYDKAVNMEDIYNDPSITHVLSYDLKKKKIVKKLITAKIRHKVKKDDKWVRITVRDQLTNKASSFLTTEEHPIFLKDGSEVEAKDIKKGFELITYGGNWEWCEKIDGEYLGGEERVKKIKSKCMKKNWGNPDFRKTQTSSAKERANSEEGKERSRKNLEKHWSNPKNHVAQSEKMKERWKDPEYRTYIKECQQRWFVSEDFKNHVDKVFNSKEFKELCSKNSKAAWARSPERLEKHLKRLQEYWSNPENREKLSKKMSKVFSTPEMKEKLSNNSRESWEKTRDSRIISMTAAQNRPEVKGRLANHMEAMWTIPEYRALWKASSIKFFKKKKNIEKWRETGRKNWANRSQEDKDRTLRAMLKGQESLPNKPEKAVINMGINNLVYTGAGDYWLTLNFEGTQIRKNPDFIYAPEFCGTCTDFEFCKKHWNVEKSGKICEEYELSKKFRTSKVVEVIGCREYTNRGSEYDKKLKKAYSKAGVKCLIVDADKGITYKNRPRIESHINNHYLTVTRVEKVQNTNPKIGNYKYDLTVQDTENYFVTTCRHESDTRRYNVPVLVHNCANRVIRIQSTWSPGGQEQALARVLRPDPRGIYKREEIYYDQILCCTNMAKPTLDTLKAGKLISKLLNNAQIKNANKEAWKGEAEKYLGIQPIKLSIKNLESFSPAELAGYLTKYEEYKAWEFKQNVDKRVALAKRIQEEKGIVLLDANDKIIDIQKFVAAAVVPVVSSSTLPGSRAAYTPWVSGAKIHNPLGFPVTPLSSITSELEEEEEEDGDLVDNVVVAKGMHVITEFGPGTVVKLTKAAVSVDIPGFKIITLPKTLVFAPTNLEDAAKLKTALKTVGQGFALFKPGKNSVSDSDANFMENMKNNQGLNAKQPLVDDSKQNQNTPAPITPIPLQHISVELEVGAVDGEPCAFAHGDSSSLNAMLSHAAGWQGLDPYVCVHVSTYQALSRLLTRLALSYRVPSDNIAQFEQLSLALKSSKGRLKQTEPYSFSKIRTFITMQHLRIPKAPGNEKQVIRPWSLVQDGDVYLCLSIRAHPFPVLNMLKNMCRGISGLSNVVTVNKTLFKFFKSPKIMEEEIKKLNSTITVTDLDEVINTIHQIHIGLLKPVKLNPQIEKLKKPIFKPANPGGSSSIPHKPQAPNTQEEKPALVNNTPPKMKPAEPPPKPSTKLQTKPQFKKGQ